MKKFTILAIMILIANITFAQISWENSVVISTAGDLERGYSTQIGDLDGDGDNDIVASGMDSDNIIWYENDGNGNFGTANVITDTFNGASYSAIADIDGDGDNDILASAWYDGVIFLKNNGTGSFTEQVISDTLSGGWHIYAKDIDGDNVLDVVVTARNEGKVYWFKTTVDSGTGTVTFGAPNTIVDSMNWVGGMYIDDIDGDGDNDIAVADLGYGNAETDLWWYANDGSGNFTEKQKNMFSPASVYDQIENVWIGDIDNDGDKDIVFGLCSDGNGYEIAWVENSDGFGTFTGAQNIKSGASENSLTSMIVADFDTDNDYDIIFSYSAGATYDKISFLENEDNATSFSFQVIESLTGDESPWVDGLGYGDLDGDNDLDISFTEYRNDYVAWIRANVLPAIYEQPVSIETCAGQDTLFGIKANLADSYQWEVNDGSGFVAITDDAVYSNSTTDTLIITGITTDMNGYVYRCVVTNTNGTSTSNEATLTVSQEFSITGQPQNVSLVAGETANFTVTTDITDNLTYQWRFNGTNLSDGGRISGATTPNLQISDVTVHEAGNYDCVITGICNEITSDVATLDVATGVENIEKNISVYPNPATDFITIDIKNSDNGNVQIIDITGTVIYSTVIKNHSAVLNIKNQPAGMYFVKITTNNNSVVKEIIKK